MERDLLPPEPAVVSPSGSEEVDGRGWSIVIMAMVLIGALSLRPTPQPGEPVRILHVDSQTWMADALPGIGVKTRDQQWRKIRAGEFAALPERARTIARQIFIWPDEPRPSPHTSGSGLPAHR